MPSWLPIDGWRDLADIALVAALGWLAIGWLRRTRARAALAGLAFLGIIYFAARLLELRLSESLLQAFFAVLVLVLVVVFQEDLRRLFEQLGSWRRPGSGETDDIDALSLLVRTVTRLAATRTGALVVLPGDDPLERHVEGGIPLRGEVSEPLLLSLFDASSPGHDGAVILRGRSVERFAVHLPLSSNQDAIGPGGTRHAAALGLSERCDATCIVVSEERGTISIARNGELRIVRPEALARALQVEEVAPEEEPAPGWLQPRVALDAAIATGGAILLWVVLVPGSDVTDAVFPASVRVTNLPAELELQSVDPSVVEVTLSGLRRNLLLVQPKDVEVRVDAYLARLGRRTFTIAPQDILRPDSVSISSVDPDRVRISVEAAPAAQPVPPAAEAAAP